MEIKYVNRLFYIITLLHLFVGIQSNYVSTTCKTGKLSNVAETIWKGDKTDTTIMVESSINRFRNNDNMVRLNDKRRKVLRLGNDIYNSSIDWDNYRCYSCVIHNPVDALPYITDCNVTNYNYSSVSEYSSKIVICKEVNSSNNNIGLSNIIQSEVKGTYVIYRTKNIHTLSVLVCLIKYNYSNRIFRYFGYLVSAVIFLIMMIPIIILYNMYKSVKESNEIVEHDIYYTGNNDVECIKLLIQ